MSTSWHVQQKWHIVLLLLLKYDRRAIRNVKMTADKEYYHIIGYLQVMLSSKVQLLNIKGIQVQGKVDIYTAQCEYNSSEEKWNATKGVRLQFT